MGAVEAGITAARLPALLEGRVPPAGASPVGVELRYDGGARVAYKRLVQRLGKERQLKGALVPAERARSGGGRQWRRDAHAGHPGRQNPIARQTWQRRPPLHAQRSRAPAVSRASNSHLPAIPSPDIARRAVNNPPPHPTRTHPPTHTTNPQAALTCPRCCNPAGHPG